MTILCQPAAAPDDLISNLGGNVRSVDDLDAALRALNDDSAEDLVVVGPDADARAALRFAAELRLERPATGLILVREHVDVDLLTEALRAGVREVVAAGDTVALVAACERSRALSGRVRVNDEPEPEHQGQIVTVFAAKGGCGKTTHRDQPRPRRWREATAVRVCVVDLDLAFGDVAISVQLDPVRTDQRTRLPMAGHLDITGAASRC